MRSYTAHKNQSTYDVAIQKFGSLNEIGSILDAMAGDPNEDLSFGEVLELQETSNTLASQFEVNQNIFSTYEDLAAGTDFRIFDDTFDDSFE